ncbi:hypothetical protein K435DRAFT_870264 [Dendrothele bispora CBS 962.96]|uniref:DUF6533 domain-containing protein n=1 Tax=Dendrothele bispora (strain CBS 962.96) TaxID=1314807 RepID=A0A4S8L7Q6_DENBC|nr:hypothetical protein K435DRAFT_870264 [Dendrothele bispora CBS 962.96]
MTADLPILLLQAEQTALYVLASSLTVIVWEILTNLADEYEMIARHKLKLPTTVYVLSRLASLSYLCVVLVYFGSSSPNCSVINIASHTLLVTSTNSHAFLFLLRVRSIVYDVPKVQKTFTTLWFIVLVCSAGDFLFAKPTTSQEFETSETHCTYADLRPVYGITSITMGLVFDTVVYLAISLRLFCFFRALQCPGEILPRASNHQHKTRVFVFGRVDLPVLARSLFQDGQFYYIPSNHRLSFLITVASIADISVPLDLLQYNLICVPFYAVFMNVISCYVYRNTKLGRMREPNTMSSNAVELSEIRFHRNIHLNFLPTGFIY